MKKFGRMIGKKFGWLIEIYYGITSERFTRIYIMAAIPIFGFGFLNEIHTSIYSGVRSITSDTFLISRSLDSMQNEHKKIRDELSAIEGELTKLGSIHYDLRDIKIELDGIKFRLDQLNAIQTLNP